MSLKEAFNKLKKLELEEGWVVYFKPEVGDKVKFKKASDSLFLSPDEKETQKAHEGKIATITYVGSQFSAGDRVGLEFDNGTKFDCGSYQIEPVKEAPKIHEELDELKPEDKLIKDIFKENGIEESEADEYGSDAYWIADSIRNLQDLEDIFNTYIDGKSEELIAEFKAVTKQEELEESLNEGKYADIQAKLADAEKELKELKAKYDAETDEDEKDHLADDIMWKENEIGDLKGELAEIRYLDNGSANDYSGYESLEEELEMDDVVSVARTNALIREYGSYDYARKKLINEWEEKVKEYPYWVVETSKAYDPEGLNIEDNSYVIRYAGSEAECKNKINKLQDEAAADGKSKRVKDYVKDEFVTIYYPYAIANATFSILKNDNVKPKDNNESLEESKEDLEEANKQYTVTWQGHHLDKVNEKSGTLEELKDYFKNRLSWSNKPVKTIKGLLNALQDAENNSYNGYDPYYYELKQEKLEEAVNEISREELRELERELYQKLNKEDIYPEDGTFDPGKISDLKLSLLISGDWKHDHLYCDYLVKEFCNEKGFEIVNSYAYQVGESSTDSYDAWRYWNINKKHKDEDSLDKDLSEPVEITLLDEAIESKVTKRDIKQFLAENNIELPANYANQFHDNETFINNTAEDMCDIIDDDEVLPPEYVKKIQRAYGIKNFKHTKTDQEKEIEQEERYEDRKSKDLAYYNRLIKDDLEFDEDYIDFIRDNWKEVTVILPNDNKKARNDERLIAELDPDYEPVLADNLYANYLIKLDKFNKEEAPEGFMECKLPRWDLKSQEEEEKEFYNPKLNSITNNNLIRALLLKGIVKLGKRRKGE